MHIDGSIDVNIDVSIAVLVNRKRADDDAFGARAAQLFAHRLVSANVVAPARGVPHRLFADLHAAKTGRRRKNSLSRKEADASSTCPRHVDKCFGNGDAVAERGNRLAGGYPRGAGVEVGDQAPIVAVPLVESVM